MINKLNTILVFTRALVLGSFFVIVAMLFIYSPSFVDIAIYIIFSLVALIVHLFFFHLEQIVLHREIISKMFQSQIGPELMQQLLKENKEIKND